MSESDTLELPLCLDDFLEASPDAIIVHDLENRVLFWNRAAEQLYGWKADEVKGRPIDRIFYLESSLRQSAVETLRDSGKWAGELRQIDRCGHECIVDVRQRLYRKPSGEPAAIISFNRDITEARKASHTNKNGHQIQSSNILAGGIAHELNNALAPIMLSAALLKNWVCDEKSNKMLSMIEQSATKGAELISDLLAFERGKGGGHEIIRKTQILRAIRESKQSIVTKNVDLNIVLADDLWQFRGAASRLSEVYQHIIQNACEAMPEGGSLHIEISNRLCDQNFINPATGAQPGAYVCISFKDEGFGINEEILDRVSEPFFTTKEPKKGSGFGLSKAQAIIKGHNGFMVIESKKGCGTTLSIYLPAEVNKTESGNNEISAENESLYGKGQLILVAEDEFFVREAMKSTLEDKGYRVITAQDGSEALATYTSRRDEIDMVVTNIQMPYMNGLELCRALKKLNSNVQMLISSGLQNNEKVSKFKSSGIKHFLPKPYTADQLAKAVKLILQAPQSLV